MEPSYSSKNPTEPLKNSSEPSSGQLTEVVILGDDPEEPIFVCRELTVKTKAPAPVDEIVDIEDETETYKLRSIHPDVLMARARIGTIRGLLWIIGATIVLGFGGIIALSFTGTHQTDAVREVLQTTLAVEVTVLAGALARSGVN